MWLVSGLSAVSCQRSQPANDPAPAASATPTGTPVPRPERPPRRLRYAYSGRVIDAMGAPVMGAIVELTGSASIGVAPDGYFTIQGYRESDGADPDLRVVAPGFAPLAFPSTDILFPLIIVLDQGSSLIGRVLIDGISTIPISGDPTGPVQDLSAAEVYLAGSGVWPPETLVVDSGGRFHRSGLAPGVYEVGARLGPLVGPAPTPFALEAGQQHALTLPLSKGSTLALRVVEADTGEPIAGAEVEARAGTLVSMARAGTTDGTGRVALSGLAPGAHTVSVTAAGFVGASLPFPTRTPGAGDPGSDTVHLTRAASVAGVVVDPQGRPVAGAVLSAVAQEPTAEPFASMPAGAVAGPANVGPAGEGLGVTRGRVPPLPLGAQAASTAGADPEGAVSSADGRFELVDLSPGSYRVYARRAGFGPVASQPTALAAGARGGPLRLQLPAAGTLSVQVLDAGGHGAEGMPIQLQAEAEAGPRVAVTDAGGRASFEDVSGACQVSVWPPGSGVVTGTERVGDGDSTRLVLRLPDTGHRLSGRVFDPLDQPVAGARVAAHRVDGRSQGGLVQAWTGADGTFELTGLPAPPYALRVDHPDFAEARLSTDTTDAPLRVSLLEGRAVHGRLIEAGSEAALSDVQVVLQDGDRTWLASSDRGRFEFLNIAPGQYVLSTRSDQHADLQLPWQVLGDGRPQPELELSLVRYGAIRGEVVDRLGRPVAGARVTAVQVETTATATSDGAGSFELTGLWPGPAELRAEHAGAGLAAADQAVEVRAGETTPGLVLRLPEVDRSRTAEAPAALAASADGRAETADEAPAARIFTLPPIELRWQDGPVVAQVAASGATALRVGDRLLEIDGEPVLSLAQARAMLRGAPGSRVRVRVRRGGKAEELRLTRPGR